MSTTKRPPDDDVDPDPATTDTDGPRAADDPGPVPERPPAPAGTTQVPPPPPAPEPPPAAAEPVPPAAAPPPPPPPDPDVTPSPLEVGPPLDRSPEALDGDSDPTTAYGTGSRGALADEDDDPVVTEADVAESEARLGDELPGPGDRHADDDVGDDVEAPAAGDTAAAHPVGDHADADDHDGHDGLDADDVEVGAVAANPPPATVGSFVGSNRETLQSRWDDAQVDFVDDPRRAVERADGLVGDVVDEIMRALATEREQLAGPWRNAEEASTEDLRLTFQRYRSMFQRLLQT